MIKFIKNNFIHIYLLVFIAIIVLSSNTIDMDYWARLLQGDAFWQLGHILKQDPFSYTKTHLWLDHEWGSSVIFSFIQNHFGFFGILFTRIILTFLIFYFVYKTICLKNQSVNKLFWVALASICVYAIPNIAFSGLRCHFFTFLYQH